MKLAEGAELPMTLGKNKLSDFPFSLWEDVVGE